MSDALVKTLNSFLNLLLFRETLLMRLTEAESLLKESSRILSSESPRSEFGQLMTATEESMGQLATYIASIRNM